MHPVLARRSCELEEEPIGHSEADAAELEAAAEAVELKAEHWSKESDARYLRQVVGVLSWRTWKLELVHGVRQGVVCNGHASLQCCCIAAPRRWVATHGWPSAPAISFSVGRSG